MKNVNIYLSTSLRRPVRQDGKWIFILEAASIRGKPTLTDGEEMKETTENGLALTALLHAIKKVCMWLLVLIGAWVDVLLNYAAETAGIGLNIPFVVATVVAVWLVVNEIISILENMLDIGVEMPPFLLPLAKYIKKQVEDKAQTEEEEDENDN